MSDNTPTSFKPTLPYPDEKADHVGTYWATKSHMRMHRPDGKDIIFAHHYFESDDKYTVDYLNGEIKSGNPFIRAADAEEVKQARFRMNPRAELKKEMLDDPEVEAEFRRRFMSEQGLSGIDNPNSPKGPEVSSSGGAKVIVDQPPHGEAQPKSPKEIIAEIEAKKKAEADIGNSTESKLSPVSTADLAKGAAGPSNTTSK